MSLLRVVSAVTDARRASLIRIVIGMDAALRGEEARNVMQAVAHPNKLHLPYVFGLGVPPQPWLDIYAVAWILLGVAFAAGWRTLWTGLALSAVMFSSLLFDEQTFSNHLYFISIIVLLLALAGAGGRYSIDSWRGRGSAFVAQWPITLLKLQLSLIYFFGAVSKINPIYLSGVVLERNLHAGGLITLPPELRTMTICAVLSAASVAIDLALALGLWLPRFRAITAAGGIVFHIFMVSLLTANLSGQLAMFAVACMALYLFFFPAPMPPATETASR